MTEWNFDVSACPKDQKFWAASKCGKVGVTYWVEQRKAWSGYAHNEQPIAWQPYIVPVHPHTKPVTVRKR